MPGSPATTPNFGIPRYADVDTASFSAQLNSVSDVLDAKAVLNTDARLSDQRVPLDGSVTDAKIADATITLDKLAAALADAVFQPGDVIWSPAAARAGFVKMDGGAYDRTAYAGLYAALGGAASPWGQGDGSTTFNVPDARSCGLMGAGQRGGMTNRTVGQFVGAETQTLAVGNLPPHSHGVNDPAHGHSINDPGHAHGFGGYVAVKTSGRTWAAVGPLAGGGVSWHALDASDFWTQIGSTPAAGTGISIYAGYSNISIQDTGSGNAFNIVGPNIVGNFFIKT